MRVAIIGGGIAGSTMAMLLGRADIDTKLFEQKDSLISGPPFCHLHAGGNLYPDISDKQCVTLLHQSIDFAKLYPFSIDYRPTVIVAPKSCQKSISEFLPRLNLLESEYQKIVKDDPSSEVLGDSSNYYRLYDEEKLKQLSKKKSQKTPQNLDDWMIEPSKIIDFSQVQTPLIMVKEYGINLFLLSAALEIELDKQKSIDLALNSKVEDIKKQGDKFIIYSNGKEEEFDYLINASGFRTGIIDDLLGIKEKRMVEFKAAYVSRWDECQTLLPEIIFHGKRGTQNGMGQFTPYPQSHFQLHGMSKNITLFEDGLVKNQSSSSYPALPQKFIKKIDSGWSSDLVEFRTKKAIEHISRYIPSFKSAKVASKPLYGAQQIPGYDPSLRVAEVSFPMKNYARCEIVKVSSVVDMAKSILNDLKIDSKRLFSPLQSSDMQSLEELAKKIAQKREYPKALATKLIEQKPSYI